MLQVLKNEQHFEFVHAKEWTDAELGQLVDDYLLLTKKQRSLSLEVDVRIDANKILLRWMIATLSSAYAHQGQRPNPVVVDQTLPRRLQE